MDTQNVSAQLYFKQLPEDASLTSSGYQNNNQNIPTTNVQTDISIENAFQKQLNLSEYYKSPEVFETIKKDFMDQAMEGSDTPVTKPTTYPDPPPVPIKIPVGPTDFLNKFIKESFGSTSNYIWFIIAAVLAILAIAAYHFNFFLN